MSETYSGTSGVADRAGIWTALVFIGGVDWSARVVGEIQIDAEEGGARIADLSVPEPREFEAPETFEPELEVAAVLIDEASLQTEPAWPDDGMANAGVPEFPVDQLAARKRRMQLVRLKRLLPCAIRSLHSILSSGRSPRRGQEPHRALARLQPRRQRRPGRPPRPRPHHCGGRVPVTPRAPIAIRRGSARPPIHGTRSTEEAAEPATSVAREVVGATQPVVHQLRRRCRMSVTRILAATGAATVAFAVRAASAQPTEFIDLGERFVPVTVTVEINLPASNAIQWIRIVLPPLSADAGFLDVASPIEEFAEPWMMGPYAVLFRSDGSVHHLWAGLERGK